MVSPSIRRGESDVGVRKWMSVTILPAAGGAVRPVQRVCFSAKRVSITAPADSRRSGAHRASVGQLAMRAVFTKNGPPKGESTCTDPFTACSVHGLLVRSTQMTARKDRRGVAMRNDRPGREKTFHRRYDCGAIGESLARGRRVSTGCRAGGTAKPEGKWRLRRYQCLPGG